MTRITELAPHEINRVTSMLSAAQEQGRTVRVAFDGGLMVKVGEGVWTEPLGASDPKDDETDAQVRVDTLRKAVAMIRNVNGPDPSEVEGYDGYDVSDIGESKMWEGVNYAADVLEEWIIKGNHHSN